MTCSVPACVATHISLYFVAVDQLVSRLYGSKQMLSHLYFIKTNTLLSILCPMLSILCPMLLSILCPMLAGLVLS